jgi:hypothetical protein
MPLLGSSELVKPDQINPTASMIDAAIAASVTDRVFFGEGAAP